MVTLADPIEQRDVWRSLWRALTSDALLMILCAIVALGLAAALLLPQEPAAGTADPVSYSRWEAEAKLREGPLYEPLSVLGLNSVVQTAWWRIALAGMTAIAALRLLDRVARLFDARRSGDARDTTLRDERRWRVASDAPALPALAEQLRQRRYRVVHASDDVLVADRAPWAEALSVALHLGLLAICAGLLLNLTLGWETLNRAVASGMPTTLRGDVSVSLADASAPAAVQILLGPAQTPLTLAPGQTARAGGVDVTLRQVTPGYRLSATTADGAPVMIRASNFVSPTTEVLVSFSEEDPERYVAVPGARLALALSAGAAADQAGRLRAFSMPAGEVVGDSAIEPEMTIAGTTFRFAPARGAVVDARYQPGQWLLWLGLALAAIGALGSLIHPMRRIVVRHHGHWTEFYASGRGARGVVNSLLA